MTDSSLVALKKMMLSLSAPLQERLLHFLPQKMAKSFHSLPPFEDKIILKNIEYDDLLDFVHYSWFLPTLRIYEKKEMALFLLALSESQKKNLASLLDIKFSKASLTKNGKDYLRSHLLSSLIGEEREILPFSFLPTSALNVLLKFSKKKLMSLIDFLGLYDLKIELKQIVDPKLLKSIQKCLSKEKLAFLKSIRNGKQAVPSTKLHLNSWDKEKKSLIAIIHRAGLVRFAKALSKEDENLIWYIIHILDIGRGATLQKLCEKKEKETIASFISKQILNVIQKNIQTK